MQCTKLRSLGLLCIGDAQRYQPHCCQGLISRLSRALNRDCWQQKGLHEHSLEQLYTGTLCQHCMLLNYGVSFVVTPLLLQQVILLLSTWWVLSRGRDPKLVRPFQITPQQRFHSHLVRSARFIVPFAVASVRSLTSRTAAVSPESCLYIGCLPQWVMMETQPNS